VVAAYVSLLLKEQFVPLVELFDGFHAIHVVDVLLGFKVDHVDPLLPECCIQKGEHDCVLVQFSDELDIVVFGLVVWVRVGHQ